MRMPNGIVVAVAVLLTNATLAAAANVPQAAVDELVAPVIETRNVKGIVVGLIDETGHREVFTYAAPGEPLANAQTIFEIGSVSNIPSFIRARNSRFTETSSSRSAMSPCFTASTRFG